MKKVLVIGCKGMAGHVIKTYLESLNNYQVIGIARNVNSNKNLFNLDVSDTNKLEQILKESSFDIVINCIGLLNKTAEDNPELAVWFNSYFPHLLSNFGNKYGFKLIHISTDCVFSGKEGGYKEDSFKNGNGFYAQSYWKSYTVDDGLIDNNVNLVILGDGKDKTMLEQKVRSMNLSEQIVFLPYTQNPYSIVRKALCTLLTSKYEGLPTVLIESLSLGVPVISVDCESGPSEIINNEHNGLLIENYQPDLFANAMNRFVSDDKLYKHCKKNAKESVQKFSMENISSDWKNILETPSIQYPI